MDMNETCLVTKEFFAVNVNNKNFQNKVSAQHLPVDS